jgi:hypothetical protein
VPQLSTPPHPSESEPHVAPRLAHVFLVQLGGCGGTPTDTQADKSKSMNIKTFSCAVSGPESQYDGNTLSAIPDAPATWKAL